MQCITMYSPRGAGSWRIHRSAELLSYHPEEGRVGILFVLLAENREVGNEIHFLHRGNTNCSLVPSWPLPKHRDEIQETPLLQEIYGPCFKQQGSFVYLAKCLTPWDEWKSISEDTSVIPCGPASSGRGDLCHLTLTPRHSQSTREYLYYSTWALGPFVHKGLHLVTFNLSFEGETYKRLVESGDSFSVDGPKRLLSQIRYGDLPNQTDAWATELKPFENPDLALNAESYDVIIFQPLGGGDLVEQREDMYSNGIHKSLIQPPSRCAIRFATVDDFFTLSLSYAEASVM